MDGLCDILGARVTLTGGRVMTAGLIGGGPVVSDEGVNDGIEE